MYSKDLEEEKYKHLTINMNGFEEKTDMDLFFASNDKSYIIDEDDLDTKDQNLVIFVDFVTEKNLKKMKIYSREEENEIYQ